MKTWKRALTLLLVLAMAVSMFTFAVGAVDDTYTLRLVDNVSRYGAYGDSDQEFTLTKGDTVTLPGMTFYLQGYTMIGWSTTQNAGTSEYELKDSQVWDTLAAFDSDTNTITLYGIWSKNPEQPIKPESTKITVTVDYNRNRKNDTEEKEIEKSTGIELKDPSWRGHIFDGWYIDNVKYNGEALDKDCTITAHWKSESEKKTIRVYVDYNYKRDHGDSIVRYDLEKGDKLNNLKKPTRKGYDFVGWYIGSKEYKGEALYEDCTIMAKWKEHDDKCHDCSDHRHKIVYTDGVKKEVVFEDVVKYAYHKEKTPTIKDPTRRGYRFAGWSPAVSKYATECVTYTAQWVPVSCCSVSLITSDHVAYLKGYGGGLIKPEATITRAEVATILYRLMDSASVKYYYTTSNSFVDVSRGDWYNEAVSTLANAGIITGYGAGRFNPNAPITRAELVVMLARFVDCDYSGKCRFVDVPGNYWAYDEIAQAQEEGWINGYGAGYFYPGANITRAEVAAILNRMLDRDDCKLKDTKHYVDNPVNAWYYEDILEASIAH